MSNTDFDPDDVYPGMVRGVEGGLRIAGQVDPDNAARSADLENSTGVPSTHISRNLDEFDAKYKAALSRDVILSNPRLMDYIRAHPMNGAISQNDWSNLDKVSDAWGEVHQSTLSPWWQRYPGLLARGAGGTTADLVGALGRIVGSEGMSGAAQKLRESVKSGIPLTDQDQTGIMAQIITGIGSMIPGAVGGLTAAAVGPELALPFGIGTGLLTMAGIGGLAHGEQVAEEAEKAGADTIGPFLGATASGTALNLLPLGIVTRPWEKVAPGMINWGAGALKRALATGTAMTAVGEIGQMIDSELAQWSYNPQSQYKPEVERMLANMAMGVFMGVGFDAFKAYVDAGKHIPPGTGSPQLDELRFKQEEVTNKALDELIGRVADTDTPEHGQVGLDKLEEFLEQHPIVSVGFDADTVNKLYPEGTKPEPNDKILGWVSNIEQQVEAARNSGRDVRIPLSQYLKAVRADPEIDKTLHDARKVGKTGLSLDDIKNMSQAQQTADETQQTLLETPEIPRYVGGLADSGSPVLDTVRRSLALDKILPVPGQFWYGKPVKGILGRKDLGLRNEGATVPIIANEGAERQALKTYPIKILGQTTGKEILSGIDLNKMPETARQVMTFFRDRESEISGNVPVYILSREDLMKLRPTIGVPTGYYEPYGNYVVLNAGALQSHTDNYIAHLMVHEYAHAATFNLMRKDPGFRAGAESMMLEFKDWLNKNEPGWEKNPDVKYAFYSPDASEFIAQAWSSPEVIEALARAGISDRLKNFLKMDAGQHSLWEGIKAFVRQAFEKIFGKLPPTIMEGVFKWSGDVLEKQGIKYGAAKPIEPPKPPEPGKPVPPIPTPGPTAEELQMFADQRALGYTKKTWENFQKLLNDERERDVKWINDQSAKDAERYTKDWWKAEEDGLIHGEARIRTYAEPVISAERFLRFGYLGSEKLTKRKLNGDLLTDDQKAQLNPEYFQKGRGGLDPDRIAPWFGYRSGAEMVSELINISNDMKLMGKSPNEWVAQVIKNKARQMMEEKHGTQAENILKEAQSRVINLGAIDMVHADLVRVANLAGIDLSTPEAQARAKDLYGPITKEQLREMAVNELNTVEKRGDVDAEQLIDRAQKQGRAIEDFLTNRKNIEAFKLSQSRMITMWKTYEMRDFEELEDKALARMKRHVEREPDAFKSPKAAPFHDWIQLLMNHLGMNVRANPADLLNVVMPEGRNIQNFADFLKKVNDPLEGYGGKTIPAPPWLRDLDFRSRKKIDDYTVGEARNIYETILALDKFGREARKVEKGDQKLELDEVVEELVKGAKESGKLLEESFKGPPRGHLWRYFDAVTMMPERFWNRMDGDNPRGPWNQNLSRRFTESANHFDAMGREVGKEFRKIMDESKIDLNKPMEAPVILTRDRPFTSWTRENLITLMFNMGNKVNWSKMYKGRGLNDDQGKQLWSYVMKNATEDEWKFVSKMGELFYKIKREKVDPVYLRTVGFPPDNIPTWDVVTPFGTFKGWYYPLIADRQAIGRGSKTGAVDVLDGADHFSLAVPNPHAQERTGAVYPLSLSMQDLPSRMNQILYDVAFKENLGEAAKLWYDKRVQNAITNYQGPERRDAINAMFERVAQHNNLNSAAAVEASRMNEFLRQNVMSFYVGLNIGTVIKHGPTAFVNSIRRIGAYNLMRGYAYLFKNNDAAGESWNQWVNQQEEISRRGRDWAERFGGAYKDFTQTTLAESIRNWGSKPVAFVDMLSSKAEFLGAYLKAIDEGQTENQAIFEASRSVRFSHGTTAPTNTPLIATGTGLHSWATSLYHFFGTMLQNRMEIAFRLNKMYRLGREGELKQAANLLPLIMGDVFAYVVFPTLIEEYATGLGREDRRGIGQRLGWATVGGLANAVPYARDIVHALEYGVNQEGGLADSAIQPLQQAFKDVSQAVEGKKQIYNAKYAGNLIQDLINLTGYVYGTPREIGNIAKYGWNVSTGVEVPHTGLFKEWFEWGDVGRGLTHGSQKMSKIK